MKTYFTFFVLLGMAFTTIAQPFWGPEDFGSGCNQGQLASSYIGFYGTWTVVDNTSGNNAANKFYVSAAEAGTGVGNCGDGCLNTPSLTNATLHVGAVEVVYQTITLVENDMGASYNVGGIGAFGFASATDLQAESPSINCQGQSNVHVTFNYLEGGQGTMDNATLVADFGSGWVFLDDLSKTSTGCSPQGTWTSYSRAIPEADGQPSVKIGFTWVNNDDGAGEDPSFAVDDIALYEGLPTNLSIRANENQLKVSDLDGSIEISLSDVDEEILVVNGYDILGQMVVSESGNGNNMVRLNTDRFSGILILQIETSKGIATRKLVIH